MSWRGAEIQRGHQSLEPLAVAALPHSLDACGCIKEQEQSAVSPLPQLLLLKSSYRTASYPPGIPPLEYTI
jgi:hypothetical protein